jgi:beta-lactamase class A
MKRSALALLGVLTVVEVGAVVGGVLYSRRSNPASNASNESNAAANATPGAATGATTVQPRIEPQATVAAELAERLRTICAGALGDVGVAVIHVETGQAAEFKGARPLPLYSVFKLPLAITVLRRVEEKKLSLDQKVSVTPDDVAPGAQFNSDLWRQPVEKTVAELLEYSIVRSDNTSSDKLLQLVGGPAGVTEEMRALGFSQLDIKYSTREFAAHRDKPNTGSASDLAQLLAKLQQGELLRSAPLAMLLGFMERARTGGERRLRAGLPPGTQVADKTGSGEPGSSTNDVGLITLPEGKGHLAIAVLVSRSKLTVAEQEKLIAQLARAAYDSYVAEK